MLSILLSFCVLCVSASASSFDDGKPGTLRHAVSQDNYEPLVYRVQATPTPTEARTTIHTVSKAVVSDAPKPSPALVFPASIAPSSLGPPLGQVGTETSAFRDSCRSCCQRSKRVFPGIILFRRCSSCRLSTPPSPPRGCPDGTSLGFRRNPRNCFQKRCHQMLRRASAHCGCWE